MDTETLVGARVQGYTVKRGVVRYNICVTLRRSSGDGEMFELEAARQRWSVCLALNQALKKKFSKTEGLPVLKNPNSYLRGASQQDVNFLRIRAEALNSYLCDLMKFKEVRECEVLLDFLSKDILDAEEMQKQSTSVLQSKVTDSNSTNTSTFDRYKIEEIIRSQLRNVPFTCVRVNSNDVHRKEIHVSAAEVTIVYEFKTETKDIGLSVDFRPDAGSATTRSVSKFTRWPSHVRSQLKHFSCPCPGTLILSWDNSYSKFRAKRLSYRYTLTSTQALEWLVSEEIGQVEEDATDAQASTLSQDRHSSSTDSDLIQNLEDSLLSDAGSIRAKEEQSQRRKSSGIMTSPPLRLRFPGRTPSESFAVSGAFGSSFSPNQADKSLLKGAQVSANSSEESKEESSVHALKDAFSEIEELRSEILRYEQRYISMQAQIDDQNERNLFLQEDLNSAISLRKESEKESQVQSDARARLEKENSDLHATISNLNDAQAASEKTIASLHERLKSSARVASAEVDSLVSRNHELEERLSRCTCAEAKQLQLQAEAELMASRNMMRRYAAELEELKPKHESLQVKVDRFKAEKRILVKAVEELRTSKAVVESQLEQSRKYQEHQRQQYMQTHQQYNDAHKELRENSKTSQILKAKLDKMTEERDNLQGQVAYLKENVNSLKQGHDKNIVIIEKTKNELSASLKKARRLEAEQERLVNEYTIKLAESNSYAARTQKAAERAVSDIKKKTQQSMLEMFENHKKEIEELKRKHQEHQGSVKSLRVDASHGNTIPGLGERSQPSSFDGGPRPHIEPQDESSMASLGANLLSMLGRRQSSQSSTTSKDGDGANKEARDPDFQGVETHSNSSPPAGKNRSSRYFSGWTWQSVRNSENRSNAEPEKVVKQISWGILGEPHMQDLIRNRICGQEQSKINKLYNWLGHVKDGQPLEYLPTKGIELNLIEMRTCGVFLDCVLPFLNLHCHADGSVEAFWLKSSGGETTLPRPEEWRNAKLWIVDVPDDGEGSNANSRERTWTVEALLGKEAAREGRMVNWRSRFSLLPGEEFGTVHVRLHMTEIQ